MKIPTEVEKERREKCIEFAVRIIVATDPAGTPEEVAGKVLTMAGIFEAYLDKKVAPEDVHQ